MTSYNRMGCTYVGHSAALQREILRSEWGFQGVIISDAAMNNYQHALEGLVGGTDFWCMSGFYNMVVPGAELRNVELKITSKPTTTATCWACCGRQTTISTTPLSTPT